MKLFRNHTEWNTKAVVEKYNTIMQFPYPIEYEDVDCCERAFRYSKFRMEGSTKSEPIV